MSLNPGQQTFEKMISGMYMGELVFILTNIVIITSWSTRLAETGKSGEARCGGHGRGGLDVPRPGHHHHQVHFVKTDAIFCKKFQFTIFHNTLEYSHNTLEYSQNTLEYSHNILEYFIIFWNISQWHTGLEAVFPQASSRRLKPMVSESLKGNWIDLVKT